MLPYTTYTTCIVYYLLTCLLPHTTYTTCIVYYLGINMFVTLHYIYYLCHLYYMVFFSLDLWHGSFGFCNKKVIAKKGFAILVPAELRGRQRGQLWRVLLHRHKFGRLEGLLQGRLLLQFRLKTFFRKPLSLFLHFVFSMQLIEI